MRTNNMFHAVRLLTMVALFGVALPASAAVNITVPGMTSPTDQGGYYTDGNSISSGANVTVGTSSSGSNWAGIFVFRLPDLQGESFMNAIFSLDIFQKNGTPPKADIFGLRISGSSSVSAADFNAAGTKLFEDFLDPNNPAHSNGANVSSSSGVTAFNDWLRAGYKAGDYAVIAIRGDSIPSGKSQRWLIDDATAPRITFNPIPEPATYALIFGGLTLGYVMLRRRSKS